MQGVHGEGRAEVTCRGRTSGAGRDDSFQSSPKIRLERAGQGKGRGSVLLYKSNSITKVSKDWHFLLGSSSLSFPFLPLAAVLPFFYRQNPHLKFLLFEAAQVKPFHQSL